MLEGELDHEHTISQMLASELLMSFSLRMLPWALGFAFLGGICGLLYGKLRESQFLRVLELEKYSENLKKEIVERTEDLEFGNEKLASINKELLSSNEELEKSNKDLEFEINERKLAQRDLKESEEKYRKLIQTMHEFVLELDLDGNFLFVNDPLINTLGYLREELMGSNFFSLVHPDDIESTTGHCRRLKEDSKEIRNCEYRLKRKDGTYIDLIANGDPVFDSENNLKSILQIAFDITHRKQAEKELIASEKKYSTLVEKGNDGIIIIQDGLLRFVNSKIIEITGFGKEEVEGKAFIDFVAPMERELVRDRYQKRMAGEIVSSRYEIEILSNDGRKIPVEISASIIDYKGKPADMAIIRDITTRKRIEKALDHLRYQLELILNSAGEGIFGIDRGCNLTFVNPAAARILGYEIDELIGKSMHEKIHHSRPDGSAYPREECPSEIVVRGGIPHNLVKEIFWRKDGTSFPVEYTTTPINADGKISGAVVIFRDITERNKAEEELKRYNKELEESNHLKDLFRDVMHHDLSNPLSIIGGMAEIKLDENPEDKELGMILSNAKRSMDLIESAINLSRLEVTETIEFEELNLKEMISGICHNLMPMIEKAGMGVENDISLEMPISANKIVEEVFINIISNAIKYAREGKRIVLESEDEGDFWRIAIKDFGPGISEDYKEDIFDRFKRKEKKGVKGSGLGLAIAKKIVELHRGKIWIEDNPEGGAVFLVELPKNL